MMRQDYQPHFSKLKLLLSRVGAVCVAEDEL